MPEQNPLPAHFLRWQAHVEAGRIGRRAAPDPAAAATAAAMPPKP